MDINYYKQFEPIDGKWYITKRLGQGGFGTVFEVERKDFKKMKSAMKIITVPASQSDVENYQKENFHLDEQSVTSYFYGFVEEFMRECEVMFELRGHSNIVSYEDHDVKKHKEGIGWDIFIRMELLTPIHEYYATHAPTQNDVIKLGIDICKALEVCQKQNIIHRDIKPSNIFISKTGEYKLGDFGVARALEKTSSALTRIGTYTYMAPEVYKGEKYSANVDLYSLGIVMYRLLNNNMEPFRTSITHANDSAHAMGLRMSGAVMDKPLNASNRLSEIILKACSFNPSDRYESPAQMRAELEGVLQLNDEGTVILSVEKKEPESETVATDAVENEYEKTQGLLGDTDGQNEFETTEITESMTERLFEKEYSDEENTVVVEEKSDDESSNIYDTYEEKAQEIVDISEKDHNEIKSDRVDLFLKWLTIVGFAMYCFGGFIYILKFF